MFLKRLLLQFVVIVHSISQDIRSLELTEMIDTKYQCNSPDCSPSTIVSVLNLIDCQIEKLPDVGDTDRIKTCFLWRNIGLYFKTDWAKEDVVFRGEF